MTFPLLAPGETRTITRSTPTTRGFTVPGAVIRGRVGVRYIEIRNNARNDSSAPSLPHGVNVSDGLARRCCRRSGDVSELETGVSSRVVVDR